ncbi:MAG: ornithine cyclodeaminase family protein [Proteobacteria bacterium]|nr:ornithine cyclodeaminase family protein [Pseudomonadota bacterium]
MIPFFDEAAVAEVLGWDPLIDAMEAALAAFSRGEVKQPVRNVIPIEEHRRFLGIMPAAAEWAMGLKLVTFYPANAGTGVPTHNAMILLFRPDTGEPLAVMDGRLITEMRTAAVSAVAARRLAPPDSRVLALIGSGVQAAAHLKALRRVRPQLQEVRVWSRTPAHAHRFAEAYGAAAMDAESAVRGADIVLTATSSQVPILKGVWLRPGAFVAAVGSPRPTWRELDDEVMASALVVDSREAVLKESGDVILSGATIHAELGEVLAGLRPPPPPGTTTVFKSVGIAVEDIAAARLVLDLRTRAVAPE